MHGDLTIQITRLKNASIEELRHKYKELFSTKETPCDNRVYLFKRIAYKLQEIETGGLSEKAQDRINDLINEYDPINNGVLRKTNGLENFRVGLQRDRRLPIPGSVITKIYKGSIIKVKVLEKGFEYGDKQYKTLSQIANAITVNHWNGYLFFNL